MYMKTIEIGKIFWSQCRTKLLQKFFLEYESWNNSGFHMRGLARELDEQINSVKRELDNLASLWILKYRLDTGKKMFFVNPNFSLLGEFMSIFLKTYNPIDGITKYFKKEKWLELVIVNEAVKTKLMNPGKNILDIFLIWEIEKESLWEFLSQIFYGRKIKFAVISTEDFFHRLEFWDKLIKNILTEPGNIFLKDSLKIRAKLEN